MADEKLIYYDEYDSSESGLTGDWREAQSFTPGSNLNISSVKIYGRRSIAGFGVGPIRLSIQTISNETNHPDGVELGYSVQDGDSWGVVDAWRTFLLEDSVNVYSGIRYAIVVQSPSEPVWPIAYYLEYNSNGTFENGRLHSYRFGSWGGSISFDLLFEVWGTLLAYAPPSLSWPSGRGEDYDGDMVYDPITETWGSDKGILATGGGRYKNQVVVIGHKKLYVGDL